MILIKWFLTLLAVVWLIQAFKPLFVGSASHIQPADKNYPGNRGEYIDYEEIKED